MSERTMGSWELKGKCLYYKSEKCHLKGFCLNKDKKDQTACTTRGTLKMCKLDHVKRIQGKDK